MIFQKNLIKLRKNAGYSARSFANKLKIPYTTYLAYEKTEREPKYSLLIEIADILNVSLDDLLGRTPANENEQLKRSIEDILSISDIKYLKLIDINSEDVFFDLCRNDEKEIEHISFKKKEILSKIEQTGKEIQKKEKIILYAWLSTEGIEKATKKLDKNIEEIKHLDKLSEFEKSQCITDNLLTKTELELLRLRIAKMLTDIEFKNNK